MMGIALGCLFLVLNTLVAIAPAILLVRRFGNRTAVIIGGVVIGQTSSFLLGGTWCVLLPELLDSGPPAANYNRWGWFVIAGGFSLAYSWAGCTVLALAAALVSVARRLIDGRNQRV